MHLVGPAQSIASASTRTVKTQAHAICVFVRREAKGEVTARLVLAPFLVESASRSRTTHKIARQDALQGQIFEPTVLQHKELKTCQNMPKRRWERERDAHNIPLENCTKDTAEMYTKKNTPAMPNSMPKRKSKPPKNTLEEVSSPEWLVEALDFRETIGPPRGNPSNRTCQRGSCGRRRPWLSRALPAESREVLLCTFLFPWSSKSGTLFGGEVL